MATLSQYLGEPRVKPKNVVAGLSVCQGYDAKKAMEVTIVMLILLVMLMRAIIMMMIDDHDNRIYCENCAVAFGVEGVPTLVHLRHDRKHEVCLPLMMMMILMIMVMMMKLVHLRYDTL